MTALDELVIRKVLHDPHTGLRDPNPQARHDFFWDLEERLHDRGTWQIRLCAIEEVAQLLKLWANGSVELPSKNLCALMVARLAWLYERGGRHAEAARAVMYATVAELGTKAMRVFDEVDAVGRIAMGLVFARIGYARDLVLVRIPEARRRGIEDPLQRTRLSEPPSS